MYPREPVFKINDLVRMKQSFYVEQPEIAFYYLDYKYHEFRVKGYALDDDDRPLLDHLILECTTGDVIVQGAIHDTELELVPFNPEDAVLVTSSNTSVDPSFFDAAIDIGSSLLEALPSIPNPLKTSAFHGGGGTFDGGGASGDWTSGITDVLGDAVSGTIEVAGSAVSAVGDTIGSVAEGIGDVAGGILGALD